MTQHLKTPPTSAVGLQVVVATRSVSLAVTGFDVIDLTVTPRCGAVNTDAVVFGSAFCGRSSKSPDVFALPGATTCVGAPSGASLTRNDFVAPVAPPDFSLPFAERARDALGNERRQLEFVNCVFRLLALGGHGRS